MGLLARSACRRSIRFFTAFAVLCCAPSVRADEPPTATANAERVAFAGALEYAASPQLSVHTRESGEASLRSRSLTYIARKFAHLMIRDISRNMRDGSNEQRPSGTRPRLRSHYDLRLSEDKFVVRMNYRF